MISRIFLTILLVASVIFIVQRGPAVSRQSSAQPGSSGHRLADSMQTKLDYIQQNGQKAQPDQTPTVMTEEEVNDYIAAGRIVLPQGVKKLRMEGRTGVVTAFLNVDFDEIRVPVANLATTPPQLGAVFSQFLADITPAGQPALSRRHTVDVFAALAEPADAPVFVDGARKSSRVSQYLFGDRFSPGSKSKKEVIQQQQNPPNLPIASSGTKAFIGDYLDVAAQTIMATREPTQPYRFDCGPLDNAPANSDAPL